MESLNFIVDPSNYTNLSINSNVSTKPRKHKTDLKVLISSLKKKIKGRDSIISKIKYPKLLLTSLNELNDMIGMDRLKESIALQVMRLIQSLKDNKKDKSMLNTILYGPPGVGKTKVGIILAKIWHALGYLNSIPPTHQLHDEKFIDPNTINSNQNGLTTIIIFVLLFFMTYIIQAMGFIYDKLGLYWLLCVIFIIILVLVAFYWFKSPKINTVSTSSIENIKLSDTISDRDIITVVSRRDLVADYVGQTAGKTRRLLMSNLGKVIFIDEAYSLLNDSRDPFGLEALTTLNLFMSENPDGIVVIFAGYKDLMQKGIFKEQPGLPRRCMWHFECDSYTGAQLAKIFLNQVRKDGWDVENEDEVISLIEENINLFPSYGGDTERLCSFSLLELSRDEFLASDSNTNNSNQKILTLNQIRRGIDRLKANNIHKDGAISPISDEQKQLLENIKQMLNPKSSDNISSNSNQRYNSNIISESSDISIST